MGTHGRVSTIVATRDERIEVLRGTLDMLILRTLVIGPTHGHAIAKHIQQTTNDLLQVEHGSLYPALHRLEEKGLVGSKWAMSNDRNRELRFYRLTAKGKRHLLRQESKWKQMTEAIARLMWPAAGGQVG